jgi:hypothetical protein
MFLCLTMKTYRTLPVAFALISAFVAYASGLSTRDEIAQSVSQRARAGTRLVLARTVSTLLIVSSSLYRS